MTRADHAAAAAHDRDIAVLYCMCANTRLVADDKKHIVTDILARSGRPITVFHDLCGAAAARDPRLKQTAAAGRLLVIACYPRAVQWLLHRAGAPLDKDRTGFINLRVLPRDDIAAVLRETLGADPAAAPAVLPEPADTPPGRAAPDAWRPWYPTIDYDRCTNCRQCLDFCLFGVYTAGATGAIEVKHPDHCKDNCPACARMCPAMAIIFPKIDEQSPINGSDADAASATGKVCLSREELFGENMLEQLRARRPRPALFKPDPGMDPA